MRVQQLPTIFSWNASDFVNFWFSPDLKILFGFCQTSVESSRLLAVIVPLKPLLRSRVAWGSTMWDWPELALL